MKVKLSKKYVIALTIIGVITLILITIGGTYAYFSIQSGASSNTTNFSGTVQGAGIVTGEKGVETAIINLSNTDMSSENTGKYYATSIIENNYNKEEEILNVFKATLSSSQSNEVYTCTFDLKVDVTGNEALAKDDAVLNIIGTEDEELDTSYDLSNFSTLSKEITWKFIGDSKKELNISAYIENKKDVEQNNSLSGASITINTKVENFTCSVRKDTEAPESFTFYLGGEENPRYTTETELEPYLRWNDTDITHYCLNEENNSSTCNWVKVSGNSVKTNYTISEGDGEKIVYAFIKDEVGNVSPAVKSTITLLTNPPTNNSIAINNNATYTTSNKVTLSLSSNGATEMCISESENCTNWESYTEEKIYTLSSALGQKTIYVKFRDPALNETDAISKTIMLYEEVKVPSQSGNLTYTGSSQTPTWNNYDSSKLTIGGTTSSTNAGTYNATFTPKTNYIWSDGTSTSKTVSWTMNKTNGSVSLSSSSLSIKTSKTGTFTVTRSGNGSISASSSNTSVATVSVSGTTVTVTGKGAGSTTITVNVAAGTNHNAVSKTMSVTVIEPLILSSYLINNVSNSVLWNSTLEDDGYRYVGTNPSNYICFGTSDKSTCTGDTDKYMYRIIGIFEDSSGNKHVKLIKKEALNTAYAWDSGYSDVNWNSSTLYTNLNGSYFLTNTSYPYMQNETWTNKISTWNYTMTNTVSYPNGANYVNYTVQQVYLNELNRSSNPNTNTIHETLNTKISLMYVSDHFLSLGSNALTYTAGSNASKLSTGWIHISNNDSGTPSGLEWTMTRYGDGGGAYDAWYVIPGSLGRYYKVSNTYAVRPVFYLTSTVEYSSGSGTLSDPFIIVE